MGEIKLAKGTLITSKTDLKGNIIYANKDFCKYARYEMGEVLNKPHNIIRHESMPKCVFKLLWQSIQAGKELFAFVKNKAKGEDFYWVFAVITPTFDDDGKIIDYYSVRRAPNPEAIELIEGIYKQLLECEQKGGVKQSLELLQALISKQGLSYNEFIYKLQCQKGFSKEIKL